MSTSRKDFVAVARAIADQYVETKAFQGDRIRAIAENIATNFAQSSKTFDRERFLAAALPDRPCDGYVFVDVCDGDVIHVYGAPSNEDEVDARDFIWNEKCREHETDVLCGSRQIALNRATTYAAECATRCGCEWGTND
jgi:hypothetical protein